MLLNVHAIWVAPRRRQPNIDSPQASSTAKGLTTGEVAAHFADGRGWPRLGGSARSSWYQRLANYRAGQERGVGSRRARPRLAAVANWPSMIA